MKKNVLVMISGIAILGGIGWLGARHAEHLMLDKSIERFRQTLGPDASFTYKKATPGVLGRSVKFTSLVFRQGPETITADEAEVSKPVTKGSESPLIEHLTFRNFQMADTAGSLHLAKLAMEGVTLPVKEDVHTPAHTLSIQHAEATKLHGFIDSLQSDIAADTVTVDDFGESMASHLEATKLQFSADAPPARHVSADHVGIDGLDLAGLYNSLTTGTAYTGRNGTRDIQIDHLAIDGDSPLLRAVKILSHSSRSEAAEQEVSSVQDAELWPSLPNMSWLPALGYDHLRASVVLNDTHDLKTDKLHIEELSVDAAQMGRLHLDGDFAQAGSHTVVAANADMQVLHMHMNYMDHGLVPKILDQAAKARNMNLQDMLSGWQEQTKQGNNPILTQALAYALHPEKGPLDIYIQPQRPLPLMTVLASLGAVGVAPQIAQQVGLSLHTP